VELDYYTATLVARIVGATWVGCTLLSGGRFLKAMGAFFLAYAASVGIFTARAYLPPEFEVVTRLTGVTLQGAALLFVAWMCWRKEFD
jgi:hypothetical protein